MQRSNGQEAIARGVAHAPEEEEEQERDSLVFPFRVLSHDAWKVLMCKGARWRPGEVGVRSATNVTAPIDLGGERVFQVSIQLD